MNREPFQKRFGPRALVLGGSEGLGLALAEALASRGLDLVLTGRRKEALDQAADIVSRRGVEVRTVVCDLADPCAMTLLADATDDLEIGTLVYNAAQAPNGRFLDLEDRSLEQLALVNVLHVIKTVRHFGNLMVQRHRGAVVLMGSLSSLQGSGWLAGYASTKSFIRIFGESLWAEFRPDGVRVLTCMAGATGTPNFKKSGFVRSAPPFPPVLPPEKVAEAAVRALSGDSPVIIPGFWNRFSAGVMGLMPRKTAINIMSRTARKAAEVQG